MAGEGWTSERWEQDIRALSLPEALQIVLRAWSERGRYRGVGSAWFQIANIINIERHRHAKRDAASKVPSARSHPENRGRRAKRDRQSEAWLRRQLDDLAKGDSA
jgi:hypothetical protein